ncbi:protein farnesyltransferase subunit beta isoform X2 [Vitis vinifera]|uniref:protein farnesyltransferase subunit beta isoform X2 n=1 Tax=Vitis vinifera TaxID=29760 RepID=UPI00053FA5C3|nr:protein farnesyltransferase subunit beta isoform X2 [Vitis vinifera]
MDSSETQSPTVTQREQWMVESQVFQMYELLSSVPRNAQSVLLELQRDKHIEFLTNGLRQLGPSFCVLDANRPWLCYWILHSIALLGDSVDDELENNTIDFLSRCQDPNGGYGGGPGQMPHLATTYAAINALITLGGHRSLSSINRGKVYTFLRRMKDPSGAFRMHDAGEMDVRACYTAISVASVLTILDDELVKGVGNFILSCQTYEGGISGEPGSEAHGGYTFCGLATMVLIGEVNRLDLTSLIDWVVFRQGVEGGFQGRTNKLVDGCYSFWQGGVFALIQKLHSIIEEQLRLLDAGGSAIDSPQLASISCHSGKRGSAKFSNIGFNFLKEPAEMEPLFHSIALQQYIILCSQLQEGGFRDKPGKHRDYYHTCYCLSGLSVAQYSYSKDADSPPLPRAVFGPYSNLLEPIHPLYNVILDLYHEAHEFFSTS